MALGILGIVLALALLMYLAYRGITVLVLAPATALLAAALGGAPLLASYTQTFMGATGGFVALYFPLFLLGAIFGKLMETTGAARAIAHAAVARLGGERAVLAIVGACAVLTYGGVSLFVVAFAVYPIAAALFHRANLPKRLIPATIALGAFTFTMTALPGTPALQNAIPMPYFGTTPFAAPGLGILAAAVMLATGLAWLGFRARQARLRGEGYGTASAAAAPVPRKALRQYAEGEGYDVVEVGPMVPADRTDTLPPLWLALAPILLVVALNYLLAEILLPRLDTAYLAEARFGATDFTAVRGIWAIVCALAAACLLLAVLGRQPADALRRAVDDGASAAVLPIFNTASLVGFGAVVAALPAFAAVRDAVLGLAPGYPLVSLSIAVNVLAGMTGSASGGMSIALQTLGGSYLEMGRAAGLSPELLHRVTTIATGGLDTLPHNGAVLTLLSICKLSHRQAYGDLFMAAVPGPLLALAVVVLVGSLWGAF